MNFKKLNGIIKNRTFVLAYGIDADGSKQRVTEVETTVEGVILLTLESNRIMPLQPGELMYDNGKRKVLLNQPQGVKLEVVLG